MTLLNNCSACLRALQPRRLPTRALGSRFRSSGLDPEPRTIDEDEDDFDDVLSELHRRRKKQDAKRNRQGGDFVDFLRVTVRAGKGGSGTSAFLPTKKGLGPPSGGNGGPGGSVYLKTSPFLTSLSSVNRRLIGGQGGHGAGNLRHGRRGEDVFVEVPVGTVIREVRREGEAEKSAAEDDAMGLDRHERRQRTRDRWLVQHPNYEANDRDIKEAEQILRSANRWMRRTPTFEEHPALVLDIAEPVKEPVLLSRGGVGGLGNPHFMTQNTRHPRIASRGVLPATRTFEFELKLVADVGLVGLPNVGKSTLLRGMTGRRAEVADYAFTTLHPQIGVVRVFEDGSWAAETSEVIEDTELEREVDTLARDLGEYKPLPRAQRKRGIAERTRFSVSDNPGLLAGASENIGLGHSFLRSIERSLALAYVLDARKANPVDELNTLHKELEAYKPGLSGRARVIALNKSDDVAEEELAEKVAALTAAVRELGDNPPEVLVTSAKYGTGMERFVSILSDAVDAARPKKVVEEVVEVAPPVAVEPPEKPEELFEM